MVLEKYQGCSGSNPGRANCSREDSRWCGVTSNIRKGSSNPGGELVFPGMIPSGVVSRPIPGRVVRTLGRELVFPGMIPEGVASRLLLFIAGHLFVYRRGCLITPATSRRLALGWPVNARRAFATAFALLTSRLGWRLVFLLSGVLSLQIQYCRWPGLAAKGSRLRQYGGVYQKPGVWACGVEQQQVHNFRPLSLGFPSLSKGTNHFAPRGQSREGFGVGLLRSR